MAQQREKKKELPRFVWNCIENELGIWCLRNVGFYFYCFLWRTMMLLAAFCWQHNGCQCLTVSVSSINLLFGYAKMLHVYCDAWFELFYVGIRFKLKRFWWNEMRSALFSSFSDVLSLLSIGIFFSNFLFGNGDYSLRYRVLVGIE